MHLPPTPDWRGGAAVATAMEGVGPPGTPESGWRKEMSARIKPKNKMVEQSDYRPRDFVQKTIVQETTVLRNLLFPPIN